MLTSFLFFGISVFAQRGGGMPPTTRFPTEPTGVSGAPAPYLPPHPYPEPIDPSFPKPGDVVKYYTGGWVLDELFEETVYFRSDEFRQAMLDIRRQIDSVTQSGNSQQYFSEIQQRTLDAIDEMIVKLGNKINQITNEPSLNDGIATRLEDLDVEGGNPSKDNEIKSQVTAFLNMLIAEMNRVRVLVLNATTVEQLRTYSDDLDLYVHDPARQEEGRTIAARVVGQRILHFSYNVQLVVDFIFCIIPKFGEAGFDLSKHTRYITSTNSLFYTDWYSLTPINPDTTGTYPYRSPENAAISNFPDGSFGGREEYRIAASILEDPSCKGNEACKELVRPHMKKGKRILQDMFHLGYWAYDNFIVQMEDCNEQYGNACTLKLSDVDISACPFPDVPWQSQSSTQPSGFRFPTNAFPTSGLSTTTVPGNQNPPTTRPTARPTRSTGSGGTVAPTFPRGGFR